MDFLIRIVKNLAGMNLGVLFCVGIFIVFLVSKPISNWKYTEEPYDIYNKYPSFLATNYYSDNIYYQNFLLTSRANRAKLQQKIETKSTKKVRYK